MFTYHGSRVIKVETAKISNSPWYSPNNIARGAKTPVTRPQAFFRMLHPVVLAMLPCIHQVLRHCQCTQLVLANCQTTSGELPDYVLPMALRFLFRLLDSLSSLRTRRCQTLRWETSAVDFKVRLRPSSCQHPWIYGAPISRILSRK